MSRYFVAIDLPAPLREELLEITVGLPGTRWVDEDALHLTLRFLGDVSGATLRDTVTALARIRMEPFEVQLGGIGFFPPRGEAEVLWLGVERSAPLENLRKLADESVVLSGPESAAPGDDDARVLQAWPGRTFSRRDHLDTRP